MKLTEQQLLAIQTQDQSLVVQAGAGTGKTTVLVQRFVHLLETHPEWSLDNLYAITFTEKAAREMRIRLRQEVEEKVSLHPDVPQWQEHRLNLDKLNVSTIHSLCARILRENAIACQIDPQFQVIDEQEANLLKEESIRSTLKQLEEEDHPALELLASLRVNDLKTEMSNMLNKRGTLFHLFNNLDKKEGLIERWQDEVQKMVASYWEKKLYHNSDLKEAMQIFPNIEIINPNDKLTDAVEKAQKGCQLISSDDNLAGAYQYWIGINRTGGKHINWGGKDQLNELKTFLKVLNDTAKEIKKDSLHHPFGELDELAAQHLQLWFSLWQKLERVYAQIKDALQALDFDDLELRTDQLLSQSPCPPRVASFLNSIKHLMVDEYQDTNLIQQRIISSLAPIGQAGKLFVVGDAKQSIYRFRQAQVSIFNQTAQQVQAVTQQSPLSLNLSFRSHESLVSAMNDLFENIFKPIEKNYTYFEALPGALTAARGTQSHHKPALEILLIPEKEQDQDEKRISAEDGRIWEARWIAQYLLNIKETCFQLWDKNIGEHGDYRSFEFRDAAVLFRATTQIPLYETEFKAAALPYLTISGRGYYDRPEVQDLISLLGALANPSDDLNLAAVLRSPLFCFNDETLYSLRWYTPQGDRSSEPIPYHLALNHPPHTEQSDIVARAASILEQLWAFANRIDVWSLLRKALDLTDYEAILASLDGISGRQLENVHKFIAFARDQASINLLDFLSRIRDLITSEAREGEALGHEPKSGAVQLMSIHAAKGLEFPIVILADTGRQFKHRSTSPYLLHDPAFGLVCKVRDDNGDWQEPASYAWGKWQHKLMEEAENKRLLYVACTRAADRLVITGKQSSQDSWLNQLTEIWNIEDNEIDQEILDFGKYSIKVNRLKSEPDQKPADQSTSTSHHTGSDEIPQLAQPIPISSRYKTMSVSQFEKIQNAEEKRFPKILPAVYNIKGFTKKQNALGSQVGDLVHKALTNWVCLSYPFDKLTHYLENLAHRNYISAQYSVDAVRQTITMLMNVKNDPLYAQINRSIQRYHELPFTLSTRDGSLHGIIDLLFQDPNQTWHLIDWKTEWTATYDIANHAVQYKTQLNAYASAVYRQFGVLPEILLVFLDPKINIYQYAIKETELFTAQ